MKYPFATLMLVAFSALSFGQTTFLGMTPGKSTRADVERVFGRPIQSVTKTLIEYGGGSDAIFARLPVAVLAAHFRI